LNSLERRRWIRPARLQMLVGSGREEESIPSIVCASEHRCSASCRLFLAGRPGTTDVVVPGKSGTPVSRTACAAGILRKMPVAQSFAATAPPLPSKTEAIGRPLLGKDVASRNHATIAARKGRQNVAPTARNIRTSHQSRPSGRQNSAPPHLAGRRCGCRARPLGSGHI
jgi:hypothetical protein